MPAMIEKLFSVCLNFSLFQLKNACLENKAEECVLQKGRNEWENVSTKKPPQTENKPNKKLPTKMC